MALQFNDFLKYGNNSIINGFITKCMSGANNALRVYPSTVAYPSSPPPDYWSIPAGHILTYTGLTYSLSNNDTIIISAGNVNATATAAGTLSWFMFINDTSVPVHMFISDSITLAGGGGVLTVNTLTPTSGQNVSINFSLKLI